MLERGDWTIAPYTTPRVTMPHPHTECLCTWAWQPHEKLFVVKYAHAECTEHGRPSKIEQNHYAYQPQVRPADKMTWPKYGKGVPRLRQKVYH